MDRRVAGVAALAGLGGASVVAYALVKKAQQAKLVAPPWQTAIPPAVYLVPERLAAPTSATPPNPTTLPDYTVFPFDKLQTGVVPANSQATVFLGIIPQSYAAIITDVGNTFPGAIDSSGNSLFTMNWMVDGDLVERVQHIIADVNSTKKMVPPLMALQEIRWVGINRHPNQPAIVTIVQDGYMRRRTD